MLNQAAQQAWIRRLEAERENLSVAIAWLLAADDPEAGQDGATLVWLLHRFWYVCGHLDEGLRWITAVLDQGQSLPEALRADLLYAAGLLAVEQRSRGRAESWREESRRHFQALGRRAEAAAALSVLGNVRQQQGDLADAEVLHAESVTIFRELGDRQGLADALDRLAQSLYLRDDLAGAIGLQEQVLALRREHGDRWLTGSALNNLGTALHELGDPQRALSLIEETVELFSQIGNARAIARVQLNLGSIHTSLGNTAAGAACYTASLRQSWELRDTFALVWALRGIATLAGPTSPEAAARIFGKAEALTSQEAPQLPLFDQQRLAAALDDTRSRLGDGAYEAAWEAGAAADPGLIVAQASALAATLGPHAPTP